MEDGFKSPAYKLIKFFKKSRDKWKERAKQSIQDIKGYKKRIEFLEESKASLKEKNKELMKKLQEKNNELSTYLKESKKKQ